MKLCCDVFGGESTSVNIHSWRKQTELSIKCLMIGLLTQAGWKWHFIDLYTFSTLTRLSLMSLQSMVWWSSVHPFDKNALEDTISYIRLMQALLRMTRSFSVGCFVHQKKEGCTMHTLERFIVLYHRVSNCADVNSCRRKLFWKGTAIDNMMKNAIYLHVRRAAYISGYVWGNSLIPMMNLPPFEKHGWNADATPHWTNFTPGIKGS